ncbi:MAG TPA: glycosyltransferase [Chitinophagaceae bacterium]|nr:glycosyltransferase [Chitinophagaceae bacterium]
MKILHIIDSLAIGGAEMLLCNFIKQYNREQPDSRHFIITLNQDLSLLPVIKEHIEGNVVIKFSKARALKSIIELKKAIKKQSPDIIHSHLFYSTMLARLAAGKIPVVSTYHNMEYCKESPNYSGNYIFLDKLTFSKKRNYSIYVSNAVKTCVQKGVPAQIGHAVTIPNFVTNEFSYQYNYNDNKELRLVAVGNLKKVKNHLFALKEIASLNHPGITLDIYGEGNLHDDLAEFIGRHALKVRLMGKTIITSMLLCEYDAFLLPSLSEGMPVSLIEAIVSGLPSLVSDLPQLQETAGNSALYFSPANTGSLASLLKEVYNNKKQLINLSCEARLLAGKYSWQNYFGSVEDVYQQVLGS